MGLDSRTTERAALALVAFGIATAATRRATLFQVMAVVLVENGLALAALGLPGGFARDRARRRARPDARRARRGRLPRADLRRVRRRRQRRAAGACVTSREALAWAVIAAPALVGGARRASRLAALATRVAVAGAFPTAGARARTGGGRARRPRHDRRSATGSSSTPPPGCSSASSASSASPACSSRPRTWRRCAPRSSRSGCATACTSSTLYAFWAVLLAVPLAGNLGAAWLLVEGDDRRLGAARRVQRQGPGARGRLEVPDPHLARARRRAARDRHPRRRRPRRRARRALLAGALDLAGRARHDARRLSAAARRPRRQDRLGARPQLAPRRPLRGAAARLGAALRRAAAGRAARRLALRARARAGHRRRDRAGRADRLRARLAGGRGAVPLAAAWPGSGCSPTRASSTWA